MKQVSPTQQSVGCAHGSVIMRHCARHVPVGPQKPWQHWKSIVHMAPAAVHAAGRHSPATHEPWQQSFVSLHAVPGITQAPERQMPAEQVAPAQQSPVVTQPRPGAEQPDGSVHCPPTHSPEQQREPFTHASPACAHAHAPLRHSPEQQSFDDSQPSTSGLHCARHRPRRHSPRQHSDVALHEAPASRHCGPVDVVPHPAARTTTSENGSQRAMPAG
jgi:hypothetical protein